MKEVGFAVGRVSPCHFYHAKWDVCGVLRGDYFVSLRLPRGREHVEHDRGATKFKSRVAMACPGHREPVRSLNRKMLSRCTGVATATQTVSRGPPRNVVVTPALRESSNDRL